MDRTWIVLRSEFMRRLKTKWFVLSTLLAPVILIAFFLLSGFVGFLAARGDGRTVAVIDETGVIAPELMATSGRQETFVPVDVPEDSLRRAVRAGVYDGYLLIPQGVLAGSGELQYFSATGGGLSFGSRLQDRVNRVVEERRLAAANAPPEVVEILRTRIPLRSVKLTEEGTAGDSALASSMLGYIAGFIIYLAVFIYGSVVMQGVLEEKQSRVIEVMVSSVRPFDLLMGKVLGIGAVGLIQMAIWGGMIFIALAAGGSIATLFMNPSDLGLPMDASQEAMLDAAGFALPEVSFMVFVWFLLFFLGGYLFYASLFAAIGSAVEQQQDAQSLLIPVTMPIILAFIFITFLIENPNGPMAVILSMIPLFSPILMVVRLAVTEVPLWEVALSFLLLVGSFVGAVWVSARIYRVGILMYGKKANLRDLVRWVGQA